MIRVGGEQLLSFWVRIFEELADDGAFVEGFAVVLEGWNEAPRVEFEEGFRLVVWIYLRTVKGERESVGTEETDFYVLEGNFLLEEHEEDALDERAELQGSAAEERIGR